MKFLINNRNVKKKYEYIMLLVHLFKQQLYKLHPNLVTKPKVHASLVIQHI
jgi:hypothetical protein